MRLTRYTRQYLQSYDAGGTTTHIRVTESSIDRLVWVEVSREQMPDNTLGITLQASTITEDFPGFALSGGGPEPADSANA